MTLEYKVLICKKYKHAIRGLETHLEDAYRLKKKERRLLLECLVDGVCPAFP